MNIYYEAASKLAHCRELTAAIEKRQLPASVTGLSAVHKAHTLLLMSLRQKVLCICDDEAGAQRLVSDINAMAGEDIACLFPVKDFTFAEDILNQIDYVNRKVILVTCHRRENYGAGAHKQRQIAGSVLLGGGLYAVNHAAGQVGRPYIFPFPGGHSERFRADR